MTRKGELLMIDVVVLAGGYGLRMGKTYSDVPKPLLEINGRPMLEYVLKVLRSSRMINRIVVISAEPLSENLKKMVDITGAPGLEIDSSIAEALKLIGDVPAVLLVSADIPLLTREGLEDFLNRCYRYNPDLAMPAVSKELSELKFPGAKRHYAMTKDGTFTLGNLCYIKPSKLSRDAYTLIGLAAGRRKSVTRLAQLMGWWTLIMYLCGQLGIEDIETRCSAKLGLEARVIVSQYPELAFDIDSPEHLEYVRRLLKDK